jgi:DNA-binding NarL/FixJ family response regulator
MAMKNGRKWETAMDGFLPTQTLFTDSAARLTPMQLKILKGVQSGRLNKQIAFDLGIAEATVKAHMTALMRKLNVRNRTQVALAAQFMEQQASERAA